MLISFIAVAILLLAAAADEPININRNDNPLRLGAGLGDHRQQADLRSDISRREAGEEEERRRKSSSAAVVDDSQQLATGRGARTAEITLNDKKSQDEAMRSLVAAWGNWGGFNVSADPCTWGYWYGVYCDENGVVYDLNLDSRGLRGEMHCRPCKYLTAASYFT